MTKLWRDRLNETVTYVRAWNGGANGQYARQLAEHLQHEGSNHANAQAISNAMAQGDYVTGNDAFKENRKKRRAIILVRCLMHGHAAGAASAAVGTLPDGMLDSQLNYEIGLARNSIVQTLQANFTQFATNTGNFLLNNSVFVRSNNSRGVQTFVYSYDPTQRRHKIEPPGMQPQFLGTNVQINHIPVTRYSTVQGALGTIDGVDLDPAHPAVTTQLTGCSYMYQINAGTGAMKAAHIWPAGDITPTNLTTALRAAPADFQHGNGGAATIFGAEGANTITGYVHAGTWTYVVAVNSGGWQIHVQQVPGGQSQPITYTRVV